jgi:hypothetical protein
MRGVGGLAAVLAALLFAAGGTARAAPGEPFFVGFSEDLPKEIGASAFVEADALGAPTFRLTTQWAPGRTAIPADEAAKLSSAVAAAGARRLVLAVYGTSGAAAPRTIVARQTYCGYVGTLLATYPAIRDVVVWNEPNKSLFWSPQADAPAQYEALLATCYDSLPASVNVIGLALSSTGNDDAGSTSPGALIRGVGDAYRASGRTGRIFDTVAHHPYGLDAAERPWRQHIGAKPIGMGDWNKLMFNLFRAFEGTGQPIPGEEDVRLWYTESGVQTAVDAGKPGYSGFENVLTVPDFVGGEPESPPPAETSDAPDQATQALDAIRLAECQPGVTAYFNFLLADEPILSGWQSGPLWADRSRKDSWPAFRQAIVAATAGAVDCGALKGGRPSADFMPPTTPQSLRTTLVEPTRIDLAWDPSVDGSSISYRVFRNGGHVATVPGTSAGVTVAPSTAYTFTIRAIDDAGNLGDAAAPLSVTTPAEAAPPPAPEPQPQPQPVPVPEPIPAPAPPAPAPPAAAPSTSAVVAAPAAPTRLRATTTKRTVTLTWSRSADYRRVRLYQVFRDGVLRRSASAVAFRERRIRGRHVYTVRAVASDGRRSAAARVVVGR